jgi:hypothetical protein
MTSNNFPGPTSLPLTTLTAQLLPAQFVASIEREMTS